MPGGRINGIPPIAKYNKLNKLILDTFENMIPLWSKLNLLPNLQLLMPINQLHKQLMISLNDYLPNVLINLVEQYVFNVNIDILQKKIPKYTKLQVVIKAQHYSLPPSSSYSGKWHVEGLTENVVAAGVYYCEKSKNLTAGQLRFRNEEIPQPYYHDDKKESVKVTCDVDVEQDTAVVFSNMILHRMRKLNNHSNEKQGTRTFINFFIIDPSKPYKYTAKDYPVPCIHGVSSYLDHLLMSIFDPDYNVYKKVKDKKKKDNIFKLIKEYIEEDHEHKSKTRGKHDLKLCKKYRNTTRSYLGIEKTGWGSYNYGNAGILQFLSNERPSNCGPFYAQTSDENLFNTSSD